MEEHTNKCIQIIETLKKATANPSHDEKVQKELISLIGLIPKIERTKDIILIEMADLASKNLELSKPQLQLAKELRTKLKKNSNPIRIRFRIFFSMFNSKSPVVRVLLGLSYAFGVAILLFILLLKFSILKNILGEDSGLFISVALFGFFGSMASIMVRLKSFSNEKNRDPAILFFTGVCKPFVGLVFALVIFAMIEGGLIPITVPENEFFFYIALGFISGFSERFAKDAVGIVEDNLKNAK
ncbi:MAG: hypothetical protein GY797_40725 [Deltaproteobacteria bacterium]|nr:hypothetical protein [Deltaproteobacteria bacterium]